MQTRKVLLTMTMVRVLRKWILLSSHKTSNAIYMGIYPKPRLAKMMPQVLTVACRRLRSPNMNPWMRVVVRLAAMKLIFSPMLSSLQGPHRALSLASCNQSLENALPDQLRHLVL